MFGRRRRQESEALVRDAREQLDANEEQTAALVKAVTVLSATIQADIERTQRLEATADATVSALQHALSAQAADVSGALQHVASMYELLAGRIEADRADRHALADAVRQLARPPAPALPDAARPRVLGGSVFASPPADAPGNGQGNGHDDSIDRSVELVPEVRFATGSAVCCRFGDQWIDGVEIVEIVGNSTRPSYRLRRRQDGYVLPALFGARDLRLAARPPEEAAGADADARGGWARS